MGHEERAWEKSGRKKRGKTDAGQVGGRGFSEEGGYGGNAGSGRDVHDREGYHTHGRDGAGYRGETSAEMSEGSNRRTILGEVSGRY